MYGKRIRIIIYSNNIYMKKYGIHCDNEEYK